MAVSLGSLLDGGTTWLGLWDAQACHSSGATQSYRCIR